MLVPRFLLALLASFVAASSLVAAVVLPSKPAAAAQASSIVSLSLANVGKHACSTNSLGGRGYESSCTGNGGQPEYWCADFAKWVWANAGVAGTSQLSPLAGSFYTYGLEYGTLSATPAVGDAVVFDYYGGGEAEHVAIVTAASTDGSIETVSGDWGGDNGSEAHFSSTSTVTLNSPGYLGALGTVPDEMGMTISAFVAPAGVNVRPVVGESLLYGGHELASGTALTSPNGLYTLEMETDGNLVELAGGRPVWDSGTEGNSGAYASMQTNGNLIVYSAGGQGLWASGTSGHSGGVVLSLRDDGSLVIDTPTGPLWSREPVTNTLAMGDSLLDGEELISPNGLYNLELQGDGNLVLYSGGRPLWETATSHHGDDRAVMRRTGSLVVYTMHGVQVWSSRSPRTSGTVTLVLEDDGNVVISGPSGVLWSAFS